MLLWLTYDAEKKAQVLSELEAAKEGAELLGLIAPGSRLH